MCDWLGRAGRCVLSGPWRLTEPCDVTIGGATWLDQAQETAARANQNAGPHRKKTGNREPHQSVKGGWGGGWGGQVPNEGGGEATDSSRSIKKRNGTRQLSSNSKKKIKKCPQRSREEEEMQGEAWGHRQEGLKQRGLPQLGLGAPLSWDSVLTSNTNAMVTDTCQWLFKKKKTFTNDPHSTFMFMLRLIISDKSAGTDIHWNNIWLKNQQGEMQRGSEVVKVIMSHTRSHTDSFADTSGQSQPKVGPCWGNFVLLQYTELLCLVNSETPVD